MWILIGENTFLFLKLVVLFTSMKWIDTVLLNILKFLMINWNFYIR